MFQHSDPLSQFVRDCVVVDNEATTTCNGLYSTLRDWCAGDGRADLMTKITPSNLAKKLRPALGFTLESFKPHDKQRRYSRIRLKKFADRDLEWDVD